MPIQRVLSIEDAKSVKQGFFPEEKRRPLQFLPKKRFVRKGK
jgi:hypothetical protein